MSTENTNNADQVLEENVVLTTTSAETVSNDENVVLTTTTAEPDPVPVFITYDFSTNVDSNDFLLSGVLHK